MTSQLIPVFNGTIDNETILLVNARDLHSFLGVGRMFAHWVKERIAEYGFVESQDYILICQNGQTKGRGGDRRSKDYHLTLDTAKELAMVERNEKAARYADTSSSAKRNFAACNQHSNSQTRKSSSSATCRYRWRKHRTSANACIRY